MAGEHLGVNEDRGDRSDLAHGVGHVFGGGGTIDGAAGGAGAASGEGESGVAHLLGNGLDSGAVVLPGLVGETEECEEDHGADNDAPASELEAAVAGGIVTPDDGGDLVNTGESVVGVGPAKPGEDAGHDVDGNGPAAKGNGASHLDASEEHEAEVSVMGEVAVAGEELVELGSPLPEQANAHSAVDRGNETDEDGLAVNEDEGDRGVVGEWEASNILEDVEAVALNDVLQSNHEAGITKPNSHVDHDSPALLSAGDGNRLARGNMVQTAIDAERGSGDSEAAPENNARRNIAPDRCPIESVAVPDDRINEHVQASKPTPEHVKAGAGVPGLEMPWEGDCASQESQEGESRVDWIGDDTWKGGRHLESARRC